ncbi:hypothetical protein TeGR_g1973 [Tetraparma gracilis]|uniref:Uncharacterized protein n=1 Tax=Tetraparma gracilis TaxID=2962635 RepID=A0ABQ6MDT6_9STRA|nr:hypothetical protein TeGR_g1973 [Tetraparma gracilis]
MAKICKRESLPYYLTCFTPLQVEECCKSPAAGEAAGLILSNTDPATGLLDGTGGRARGMMEAAGGWPGEVLVWEPPEPVAGARGLDGGGRVI